MVEDERADEAGFDPYNKVLDRVSSDNRKKISPLAGARRMANHPRRHASTPRTWRRIHPRRGNEERAKDPLREVRAVLAIVVEQAPDPR